MAAKNLEERAEEYAESYINGNITWVMEQLKKTRKRASLVIAILESLRVYDRASIRTRVSTCAESFQRNVQERGL